MAYPAFSVVMGKLEIVLERRRLGSFIGMIAYDEITDKKKKIVLMIPDDSINESDLPQKIEVTVNFEP